MIIMPVKEGENIEKALKKFKRKYERTGVLKELRRRQYFTKPSIAKREAMQHAISVAHMNRDDESRTVRAVWRQCRRFPSEIACFFAFSPHCSGRPSSAGTLRDSACRPVRRLSGRRREIGMRNTTGYFCG